MPINLLDFIKGEGAAINAIRSAVEVGQSATEALELFREAGGKIRTQTFYQAFNYFTGPIATARTYISNIGLNNLPNIERLPESATKLLKNFSYQLSVEIVSSETGEKSLKTINIGSNQLLTKQQAIDEVAGIIEANPGGRYPYEFSGATVKNVVKNPAGITPI